MANNTFSLAKRVTAEFLSTAFLVVAVVGSGIMGERLAGGNGAIALLANTMATGAALIFLIFTFGPISGAHMNPAVTLCDAWQGGLPWKDAVVYVLAQCCGGTAGTAAANLMFGLPVFFASHHARSGGAQYLSEFIATFGLLSVIWGGSRFRTTALPFAVAAYISAAYWFTTRKKVARHAFARSRRERLFSAGKTALPCRRAVAVEPGCALAHAVGSSVGASDARQPSRRSVPTRPPGE